MGESQQPPVLTVVALSTDTWVKLVPLVVLGAVLAFLLWGWLMRNLEEVSTARRFGWRRLAERHAAPNVEPVAEWQPLPQLWMTQQLGKKVAAWHIYVRCDFVASPAGLALKYRGRFRKKSVPPSHPPLLIPWSLIAPGSVEVLRGNQSPVMLFTVNGCPSCAFALRPEQARQLVVRSGGLLRLDGPPPPVNS